MLANYVLETANNPGVGPVNLAGPTTGRRSFADAFLPTGTTSAPVFYFIEDGTQAEAGTGTVTAGTPVVLSRDTVLWSFNGTASGSPPAAINFTGTVRVYNAPPAEMEPIWAQGQIINLTATATLLATQSGRVVSTAFGAAGTITLPAPASGLRFEIWGCNYAVTVAPNGGSMEFPDGSSGTSYVIPALFEAGVRLICKDGANWFAEPWGQPIIRNATAANNPVALGQFVSGGGYSKTPDGKLVQWGSATTGIGGTAGFTFPVAFTSVVESVLAVVSGVNSFADYTVGGVGNGTLTGYTASVGLNGAAAGNGVGIFWWARGT